MKTCVRLTMSVASLLRMTDVSNKSCRGNEDKYLRWATFFPENRVVYEVVWNKYGAAGEASDSNEIPRMSFAAR